MEVSHSGYFVHATSLHFLPNTNRAWACRTEREQQPTTCSVPALHLHSKQVRKYPAYVLCQWGISLGGVSISSCIHISQMAGGGRACMVPGSHGAVTEVRTVASLDWDSVQCGSANVRKEPVQPVVGLAVPLRSCQVGPWAYLWPRQTHMRLSDRSIDRSNRIESN